MNTQKSLLKTRLGYAAATLLLIAVEVFIALFVHDRFVRPYLGDVIVVIVIYTFIRIFMPRRCRILPLPVFIFAACVEVLQAFNYVELLGLGRYRFFRILLGTSFSVLDLLCYAFGCALLGVYEVIRLKAEKRRSLQD